MKENLELTKDFIELEKEKLSGDAIKDIKKKVGCIITQGIVLGVIFSIISIAYSTMIVDRLETDIKIFASAFFVIGLICLERAYKKDSGEKTIVALEYLVISFLTLASMYIIQMFNVNSQIFFFAFAGVSAIYYIFKAIRIGNKMKKEYFKNNSDISSIVKKDEPLKREAKKRNEDSKEDVSEVKTNKATKKTTKKSPIKKIAKSEGDIIVDKEAKPKKTAKTTKKIQTKKVIETESKILNKDEIKEEVKPKKTTRKTTTKKAAKTESEILVQNEVKEEEVKPKKTTKKTTTKKTDKSDVVEKKVTSKKKVEKGENND